MKTLLVLLLGISIIGCSGSSKVMIRLDNLAFAQIDSAVVFVNSFRCTLYNIPWGATVNKEIFRDSIRSNMHDVTVRALLYGPLLPKECAGSSYDDLSGSPAGLYTITLTHERSVSVRATY